MIIACSKVFLISKFIVRIYMNVAVFASSILFLLHAVSLVSPLLHAGIVNWISNRAIHVAEFAGMSGSSHLLSNPSSDVLGPAPIHKEPMTSFMVNELYLSKVFSQSHSYSSYGGRSQMKILPFYYRASYLPNASDITITTLATQERFNALTNLMHMYQGPISVTVHVPVSDSGFDLLTQMNSSALTQKGNNTESISSDVLSSLHDLYTSNPMMSRYMDVHLVISFSSQDRHFNTWRNIARQFSRSDYVMMLDIDFIPCTDFGKRLFLPENAHYKELLDSGKAAFVLPAFEFVNGSEGTSISAFPSNKETLISLVNSSRLAMFHEHWIPGHGNTDYPRFLYHSLPGEIYPVTSYQHAYEPYVIFKKDGPPRCDERFIGYGGNKAACLFGMYLSGISFYVLADDFLVHQNHAYLEEARRQERRYNRKIYTNFREELCLKYLKMFQAQQLLHDEISANARNECQKMKDISKIVSNLLVGSK